MYKVQLRPHWKIGAGQGPALDTGILLRLLLSIQEGGSISQAARDAGLSYRHAWGLLREAEQLFGAPLMQTGRGRGTRLAPLAEKLVWADRRILARLSPLLENLASELEGELNRMLAGGIGTLRMSASHGFAVAALLAMMDGARIPVELNYRSSTDAVIALARREADLAGFHVPIGQFEAAGYAMYSRWLDPASHALVQLTVRTQGLFVAPGNPKGITGLADLCKPGVRFVNRQAGSGTRRLLELMLADAGIATQDISGYASAEFTHSAIGAYIASGMADVGFGVQTAAERFGLGFIALAKERYFFAVPVAALEEPLMQAVLQLMRTPDYHAALNALPGYRAIGTGRVLRLDEAFGHA